MKICSQCGAQCSDTAAFCKSCGTHFSAAFTAQSDPWQQPANNYQQNNQWQQPVNVPPLNNQWQQPNYPQQTGYPGVPQKDYTQQGDWLLLLVLLSIIAAISFLYNLSVLLYAYRVLSLPSWYLGVLRTATIMKIFGCCISFSGVAFEIVFIVNFFQGTPKFLFFLQLSRIISAASLVFMYLIPAVIINDFSSYASFFNDSVPNVTGGAYTIGNAFGVIAGFFLLTYYYCKSARVRTYMGGAEYIDKAIFRYR